MAAGLWLAAVTLHDVLEAVSLFSDLQEGRREEELSIKHPCRLQILNDTFDVLISGSSCIVLILLDIRGGSLHLHMFIPAGYER